jgi:hypothetical protein
LVYHYTVAHHCHSTGLGLDRMFTRHKALVLQEVAAATSHALPRVLADLVGCYALPEFAPVDLDSLPGICGGHDRGLLVTALNSRLYTSMGIARRPRDGTEIHRDDTPAMLPGGTLALIRRDQDGLQCLAANWDANLREWRHRALWTHRGRDLRPRAPFRASDGRMLIAIEGTDRGDPRQRQLRMLDVATGATVACHHSVDTAAWLTWAP